MERATAEPERTEFEIRGGWWEGVHVIVFYSAVACAILSTLGVARLATGITAVILLFYSILAIFSSPTYLVVDGNSRALVWEHYRFFMPVRRRMPREDMESLEVTESPSPPGEGGEKGSGSRFSYWVRLDLLLKDGRRVRLFRSGITAGPSDNRTRAFLMAESLSRQLELPLVCRRSGTGEQRARGSPRR